MKSDKVVFFDMDGVLCQFAAGAIKAHGFTLAPECTEWDFCTQIGFMGPSDPRFWAPLSNPDFWAGLEPHEDGLRLFRQVAGVLGKDRVALLSNAEHPGAAEGKRAWLDKHLPGYRRHALFAVEKHLAAAPCKILLDDHDPNIAAFRNPPGDRKGGHAVLIPRPWNSGKPRCIRGHEFDVKEVLDELARELWIR